MTGKKRFFAQIGIDATGVCVLYGGTMKKPLIRQETMGALYAALDAKKINPTELNACAGFFDERDFYDKNPTAKMMPGFMERENMVSDILKKSLA